MSGIPAGAGSLLNKRLGKYEILALLALGGTAEIYLARIGGAAGFEKYVVVKCLHDHLNDDQDFVKMFLDEARLAAHLDHSNIVQTMELGEHDERYYMVMEFLAGLSMAMVVRRVTERLPGGIIPVPLALNMLAQSCAGLHYAHERVVSGRNLGIVHRDISPQNLVVSFEGVVKVVDFGIAKAEQRETKTRSGTIKGKFAYMSPEQCVANDVDRRTDVFALGIIAHELVTGRRLFKRTSPYETYQAVIDCNVPKPSSLNVELDPALDELIMKSLAKDKEKRYPTAEAFGDALLGYLHHRGKGSGAGDVSRFFDQYFSQELDEHSARMRELIEGRDISMSHGVAWGADDDKKQVETVDISGGHGGNETQDLSLADIRMDRPSSGSLSDVLSNMGQTGDKSIDQSWDSGSLDDEHADDDESLPAERTRIETNPLEMLAELDKAPAPAKTPAPQLKTPMPQILKGPQPKPAGAIPSIRSPQAGSVRSPHAPAGSVTGAPPKVKMPPSGPLPLPPAPSGPVMPLGGPLSANPTPPKGNFPEFANLPTMIADLDESSSASAQSPAPLGGPHTPMNAPSDRVSGMAEAKTALAAPVINPNDPRAGGLGVPLNEAAGPLGMMPVPKARSQSRTHEAATPFPDFNPPKPPPPAAPQQRTLFDPNGGGGPPPEVLAYQAQQAAAQQAAAQQQSPYATGPQQLGGYPQHQQYDQHQQNGYPPQQNGHGYGQGHVPNSLDSGVFVQPANPNLMSPVGPQYPQAVDWEAAANAPARALPTWMLAALFAAALGVAMVLIIVIARIAR